MTLPDYDILASRAVVPVFYRAPEPGGEHHLGEFQHAGVEYCISRDHAIIGDEPGVGKTPQAIGLGNGIEAKRTLVLCPASLRLNWEREIWRWSTIPNVSTYPILKSSDGVSNTANYVITSYDLLRNDSILAAMMDLRWDHLILDEAHALKDPKGNKRTKVICAPDRLPSVCGRITPVTGTLMPNQPSECYNAVRLTNWGAIDNASLEDFMAHYYDYGGGMIRGPVQVRDEHGNPVMVSKLHWSDKVRNVPRNLEDLQYRLRKHVMVRRLKEHVLHELPAKRWHLFPLATTPEMRKALRHPGWASVEQLFDLDPDAFDHGVPVDGAISTARRELGEASASAVAAYIDDLFESGIEKLVVGCWHATVFEYLQDRLARYGMVVMKSSMSMAQRQASADAFQEDESVRIILGQTKIMGEGWTLTAAQDVVNAEPDWVPGVNGQLLDRSHRYGQIGSVTGHMPVIPGTISERIVGTAVAKALNIHSALDLQ